MRSFLAGWLLCGHIYDPSKPAVQARFFCGFFGVLSIEARPVYA